MQEEILKVDALVGLLNDHGQGKLKALREKYHNDDILKVGTLLGTATRGLEVRVDVALSGLEAAISFIDQSIQKLRRRLSLAKNVRLTGNIVALLTGAGLVTAVVTDKEQLAIVAASVNLIANCCSLIVSHLETPRHSGKESLIDLFEKLITTSVEAEQTIRDLMIYKQVPVGKKHVEDAIKKANELAAHLRVIERLL